MKKTTFRFGLLFEGTEPDRDREMIRNGLLSLVGVESASIQARGPSSELSIVAEFENADAAERLHKKIMTMLTRTEGVRITDATSNLTDLFG
jgi:hypothetical protein